MDKKEIVKFNKKLLLAFLVVLTIFATLLVTNIRAEYVTSEIESLKQTDRQAPTWLTYEDLMGQYDILCCAKGVALPGRVQSDLMLTGSYYHGGVKFEKDMSEEKVEKGSTLYSHTITQYNKVNDFDKRYYTHKTFGFYPKQSSYIARPKEAYIISEMKNELGLGEVNPSAKPVRDNGKLKYFYGNITDSIVQETAEGEFVNIVNQKYVIKTEKNKYYYVKLAKDGDKTYYIYETDENGKLVEYNKELVKNKNGKEVPYIEDPYTGEKIPCEGVYKDNIYYYYNGEFTKGGNYESKGTVFLVDYDTVVENDNGEFVYYNVTGGQTYIQYAWWSTNKGHQYSDIVVENNALATEAEAFEAYIKSITGKDEFKDEDFVEQSYDFVDETGTHSSGTVKALKVDYNPEFVDKDFNNDGKIDELDEVTVGFNHSTQTFVVGPFSLNYVKEAVAVEGRKPIEFASITNAYLKTNLGNFELGEDWGFKYLKEHNEIYPNPNEDFYIEIRYKDGLTEIKDFGFDFKYMNAGAQLDIFEGNYNIATWEAKQNWVEHTDDDGNTYYTANSRLECTSVVSPKAQTLAHALRGARWYEYKNINKQFSLDYTTLQIEKKVVDANGNIYPVDRAFQFKIYVDDKEFQDLTVTTVKGIGKAVSQKICWTDLGEAPKKYRVEEIGSTIFTKDDIDGNRIPDGVIPEYISNKVWEGSLDFKTDEEKTTHNIKVDVENEFISYKGWIEIDKSVVNPTPAVKGEKFHFDVVVEGSSFAMEDGNGRINGYSSNPITIGVDIEVDENGRGSWKSNAFRWYGSAPSYRITENNEGKPYQLVNGKIMYGEGNLSANDTEIAFAVNESTLIEKTLHVNKELVSGTKPQDNEVFDVDINLKGKFSYNGDAISDKDITLHVRLKKNEYTKPDDEAAYDTGTCKDWNWTSHKIVWDSRDESPTYNIKEVRMSTGYEFFSITNHETTPDFVNDFDGKLNADADTFITITNEEVKPLIGRIQINKFAETSDLYGKEFEFNVNVIGNFTYYSGELDENGNLKGVRYTTGSENKILTINNIKVKVPTLEEMEKNKKFYGSWFSGLFAWDEGTEAPIYTVTEVNVSDEEFVSISNGEKTEKTSKSISGSLIGEKADEAIEKYKTLYGIHAGRVNIDCINKGIEKEPKYARVVIVKESDSERLDGRTFEFKVTIRGNFEYAVEQNVDLTDKNTEFVKYTPENPLVLIGATDSVTAVCGVHDWESHWIKLDKDSPAPDVTVEEINLPDDCEFVSIRTGRGNPTIEPKVSFSLVEGVENNYVFAKNNPTGPDSEMSSLRILKKANDSLANQVFHFRAEIKGNFKYGALEYGEGKEFGDTMILENIPITANTSWDLPGKIEWDDVNNPPQYTVKEINIPEDVEFVSLSKEILDGTDGNNSWIVFDTEKDENGNINSKEIKGVLNKNRTVLLTAENRKGNDAPAQIQIIKNVLKDELKNRPYHFKVEVWSEEPFYYYSQENPTEAQLFEPGNKWIQEDVVAVADGKDYFSGVFKWEGTKIPQYKISEITSLFDDDVYAVSLRKNSKDANSIIWANNTETSKEYTNKSGKDFTIEGKLENVGLTVIWAENDKEDKGPDDLQAKLKLIKKATNELINDEECKFEVKFESKSEFTYNNQKAKLNKDTNKYEYKEEVKLKARTADKESDTWESEVIAWKENVSAPTYTVKETEASLYNDTMELVSMVNDKKEVVTDEFKGVPLDGNSAKTTEPKLNWIEATNKPKIVTDLVGQIQIIKKAYNNDNKEEIKGIPFNFKLTVTFEDGHTEDEYITVISGGDAVRSKEYTWKKNEKTPTYKVEELGNYKHKIDNATGELEAKDLENNKVGLVTVSADNYLDMNKAKIKIDKELIIEDKISKDDVKDKFYAKVTVTGDIWYKNEKYPKENTPLILVVTLDKEHNWTWESDNISWFGENSPTFTVEELTNRMPLGWQYVNTEVTDNTLVNGKTSTAVITNKWQPKSLITLTMKLGGKVWNDQKVPAEKFIDSLENGKIDDGEPGISGVKVRLNKVIVDRVGAKITGYSGDVYAYDENNNKIRLDDPVTETDENGNWSFGAVAVPTFTEKDMAFLRKYFPEWKEEEIIQECLVTYNVTFYYDGQTYEPTEYLATARDGDKKDYIGADETNNMYVDIKNENRSEKYIQSSTAEKEKYFLNSMAIDKLLKGSDLGRDGFNNRFVDIQGLTVADENLEQVEKTLMNVVDNKDVVDNLILDGSEVTWGITKGTYKTLSTEKDNRVLIKYESEDVQVNKDKTLKVTKAVDFKDIDGNDVTMTAETETAGLTFPFYIDNPSKDDTYWHLLDRDLIIEKDENNPDGLGIRKVVTKYEAIYPYCQSINLGLTEREPADLAVTKRLVEAKVVVNGKEVIYQFNEDFDLENEKYKNVLQKQIELANSKEVEFKLGLYAGDYYYRAEVYNGTEAGNALQGFYNATFNVNENGIYNSEMEVYLKYKIDVRNESETYDIDVSEIADYYDSSFELITEEEYKYVQDENGKDKLALDENGNVKGKLTAVADPSTVVYYTENNNGNCGITDTRNINWQIVQENIKGSDGRTYNKMTTGSLASKKLTAGEVATITTTFKVKKGKLEESGVTNAINLGKKCNIAEVTKFTSYYSTRSINKWSYPGQVAGRIDRDSAPNNLNITKHNERSWYEDDTNSAPIINIKLTGTSDERSVSGMVWEDARTKELVNNQLVGNGKYDVGEKGIEGLTTEIYQSISIPQADGTYKEYQFAWPTDTKFDCLGKKSINELTGFSQAVTTGENGKYSFVGIPAGNYKVRFVYGDKEIATGNKNSQVVYNGQDYKTTAYQVGFNNDLNGDGYLDNEWHEISNDNLQASRVNDARDDEARRLYISAKSEMLTYDNTSLLSVADDLNAKHDELFGTYNKNNPVKGSGFYMYAETAKINLDVEKNTRTVDGTKKIDYKVTNIDCGLEERAKTKLTLDKQIKEIKLITSDNKVVLDAIFDIKYSYKNDEIVSSVEFNKSASTGVDHVASLNRNNANQGYRYIIAEGTVLQGTQIEVKYQLTVFNMSETDRISESLEKVWSEINSTKEILGNIEKFEKSEAIEELKKVDSFNTALEKLTTNTYKEDVGRVYNGTPVGYGTYFGSVYYLGEQGHADQDVIVKTKVHQMIDYVDPDIEFSSMNNMARNQSWANTDVDYLLQNKLIDPSIVQVLDKDGKVKGSLNNVTLEETDRKSIISDKLQEYVTDTKNNLVLTVDNGESQDTGSNPGFVKFLYPYRSLSENKEANSQGAITLTVSRVYSSELDANDLDNVAEILKVENTAGRRDARNIAGNANPYKLDEKGEPMGIFAMVRASKEKDVSATEVITLSPPTGLDANESRMTQLILVLLISVTLVAVGIVVIKKKVLIKND